MSNLKRKRDSQEDDDDNEQEQEDKNIDSDNGDNDNEQEQDERARDPETCVTSEDDDTGNVYYDTWPNRKKKNPTFDKMVQLPAVNDYNHNAKANLIVQATKDVLFKQLAQIVMQYVPPVIPQNVFWKNQQWGVYPKILQDDRIVVGRVPDITSAEWTEQHQTALDMTVTDHVQRGSAVAVPPSSWSSVVSQSSRLLDTAGDVHACAPLRETGTDRDRPGTMICEYGRWFLLLIVTPMWGERDYVSLPSLTLCHTIQDAYNEQDRLVSTFDAKHNFVRRPDIARRKCVYYPNLLDI